MVLGSDGIWDRISSQEAIDIAHRSRDAKHASDQIMQIARERWRRHSPVADDITAVVVNLQ